MSYRLLALSMIAFVALQLSVSIGADVQPNRSPQSVVAGELDQHSVSIRSLDRSYLESIDSLNDAYLADRESLRKTVAKKLTKQLKTLTEQGKLDEAIAVRSRIEQLNATRVLPPPSSGVGSDASTRGIHGRGIQGTWRWNNGVDIRNDADGKTNGSGTWQLVDDSTDEYLFHWKKIPADRVKLSANGRVLEGTKANDRTFRVWAVRID